VSRKKTAEEFIIEAIKVHGNKYDYSKVNYKGALKKIEIICKKHGSFLQTPNKHLLDRGCPICNSSKGELQIRKFLDKNQIKYIHQKKFNECKNIKPLPFDFYLSEYNTCIEFDGKQHFEPIENWGGESNLMEIQKRDKIKTNYCKKNNINLIRIKFYEKNKIEDLLVTNLQRG